VNLFLAPDHRLRSGWRFAIALVGTYAALTVAGLIAYSFDPSLGRVFESINRPLTVALLLLLYFALGATLDRDPHPITTMGLGANQPIVRQLIIGSLLGFLMVCGALAWIAAAGRLTLSWQWNSATLRPFLLTCLILLAAALAEELMFRGYPFQRLLEGTGKIISVAIMAALFGLGHWANPNSSAISIANTALVGVLFAIAWLRTRSLWFCWALHFAWNVSLGVIFGLPVSGTMQFAVIGYGSAQGPQWLTGGSYGIEAGASGTAAILAGLAVVLLISRWLRPNPR
jgi:membrane protease YdiL (CAAX protease family)